MGFIVNGLRLGDSILSISETAKTRENSTYTTLGVHSLAANKCNKAIYLIKTAKINFSVEVKAFNDGVAFRYNIQVKDKSNIDDFTSFVLPEKNNCLVAG